MRLDYPQTLQEILNSYPTIVDAELVACALEQYLDAAIHHKEVFGDLYSTQQWADMERLLKDIRKIRWRWYNELKQLLEG